MHKEYSAAGQAAVVLADVEADHVVAGVAVAAHVQEATFIVVAVVVLVNAPLVAVVEVEGHSVKLRLRLTYLVVLEDNILAEVGPDAGVPLLERIVVRPAHEVALNDRPLDAPGDDAVAADAIERIAGDADFGGRGVVAVPAPIGVRVFGLVDPLRLHEDAVARHVRDGVVLDPHAVPLGRHIEVWHRDGKDDAATLLAVLVVGHVAGHVVNEAIRYLDPAERANRVVADLNAHLTGFRRPAVCDLQIADGPILLVLDPHGAAGDPAAVDGGPPALAVAVNHDWILGRTRPLRMQASGKSAARLQQDAVARLELCRVDLFQ